MHELLSSTLQQGVYLSQRVMMQLSSPLQQTDTTTSTLGPAPSGGFTPITPGGSGRSIFDFGKFLSDALYLFFWSIVGAVAFALVAALAMRIFNILTPGIDEMAELKRGNIAVGIVMMGFLLTIAIVVIAVVIK